MNENINEKKKINKMITKTIKKWKKQYFNNFQCVAGSVFHNSSLGNIDIYRWRTIISKCKSCTFTKV